MYVYINMLITHKIYSPLPKTGAHPEKYGRVLYKLLSETGASLDDIFLCKIMFLV